MKKEKVIWGLGFIVLAVLVIAAGMGFVTGVTWKMILTILLAALLAKSLWELEFFGVFFPAAILLILYVDEVRKAPILVGALLLSIGFNMIFGKVATKRRAKRAMKHCEAHVYSGGEGQEVHQTSFGENSEQVTGNTMLFKNIFGASSKYVNTDDFRSASLENSFGELKVYFDNAMMQQPQAVITVSTSFGQTEIYLPRSWGVDNQVSSRMGSVVEKNRNMPEGQHKVLLTGSVSMGELQIIYI